MLVRKLALTLALLTSGCAVNPMDAISNLDADIEDINFDTGIIRLIDDKAGEFNLVASIGVSRESDDTIKIVKYFQHKKMVSHPVSYSSYIYQVSGNGLGLLVAVKAL